MAKQEIKPGRNKRLHLCSQVPRQDLNLPTFSRFLYLLPREGLLILPFSIISGNKPIFLNSLFVTFSGQLLQQNRCRCRSRWENLDRGQYPFQPIKFVNLLVSSPCETEPYNNSCYPTLRHRCNHFADLVTLCKFFYTFFNRKTDRFLKK